MNEYEKASELLIKYSQESILKELQKNKNIELAKQVLNIDFKKLEDAKRKIGRQEELKNIKIQNIPYTDINLLTKQEKEQYEKIGVNIIKQRKYAVVTMAGGQRNKARSYTDQRELFLYKLNQKQNHYLKF